MSPASLRRFRAERLLREEFRSLRARVLASARGSLRACGRRLDDSDLEACYAQAWHGLYTVTLQGQRVRDPAAWLAVATFRRAVDEHRSRARERLHDCHAGRAIGEHGIEDVADRRFAGPLCGDAAAELDRRIELRRVFEAVRLRLSAREQRAAALCYLQGLSRAEAASAMGVSEARLRKLMDGSGAGRPGVAGKLASALQSIRDGGWCEQQASLMRGLAYGILDPDGERYRLARAHTSECPACRSFVASLRGLAVLVPPTPALLELVLAGAGTGKAAGVGAALGHGAGASAGGAMPSAAASGVAGAGAAGGGWLLAGGGVGAKLAAGCLLALGVGTGCAVLGSGGGAAGPRVHAHARPRAGQHVRAGATAAAVGADARAAAPASSATVAPAAAGPTASSAAARASREFGLERRAAASAHAASASPAPRNSPVRALAASARTGQEFASRPSPASASVSQARVSALALPSRTSAAQREFAPG